ncbi:RIP metalloprotease RseP [Rhodohalobacter sp.]|uniref:RIP metalloprotease RseP n=1 Tax=Rhodohalobacter sp. TaxID=1974210 RepID=UPI002ACEFC4A|nr:RIP metalloprotease RseP [Rhodohalobacter sp.]MDZ7757350.1 RIP metalloprotease RseP [Rhodohalobacter sp.]
MDWLVNFSSTILIFIAAIFILVTIHELGHFIAAKIFGMRVDKFSIGFPPKIFGFKKGDTEYVIGATPLGGYVSIAGMIDESMDTEFVDEEVKPDEFRAKPVWQRMIVITAGVIFNVILAVAIYAGIALHYGETVVPIESMEGAYVSENSVAHQIGMQTGDRLIGVNNREVEHFRQLLNPAELTGRELTFLVERNGERVTLSTPPNFLDLVSKDGFISQENYLPSSFSAVQEGSPAEQAGLQGGDKIVAVDGEPVNYWVQLVEKIQSAENTLTLDVERNGERFQVSLAPDPETGQIGIASPNPEGSFSIEQLNYNFGEALGVGVERSNDALFGIVQGIGKMFSGDISVRENLGGPVAIANVTREATERGGWLGFWNITAFLSVTLAIMNMLPIPALDGGHFMFLLYEGITRREPSPKVRMGLQQLGFILLIGLFILVTFNDILRTFGG